MMKVVVYHEGGGIWIHRDGSKSDCGIILGDIGAFPAFSRVFRTIVNVNHRVRKVSCESCTRKVSCESWCFTGGFMYT